MLQRTSTERVFRVAHMFCGIGAGAKGFNDAHPRVGHLSARFECAGGIDIDAGAIRNFERITGTRGTVMDLFDEIWTKPLALALAVDPRQPTDGIDA